MNKPSSGALIFFMKWGCKGHWGHGGCWGCRGHWGCRGSKVWKITTEDFRVIQVLEFSFILMFWKKYWFGRFMKYHIEICHIFLSEAVEASRCDFFENWWMKLKWPNLLKPLGTIIQQNHWSFYPSEPFSFGNFNMIHPVFRVLYLILIINGWKWEGGFLQLTIFKTLHIVAIWQYFVLWVIMNTVFYIVLSKNHFINHFSYLFVVLLNETWYCLQLYGIHLICNF